MVKASAALLIRKFLASFIGKLLSNWNQAPTANLLKAACNLLVRRNETSSNLACFILLQLGNILSNRDRQNLCTKWAKGFRKLRAANNSFKSLFSMMEQRYMRQGQFQINGFQSCGFGATAHAAFQQLKIRKVELQISRHQLETDTNQAAGNFNS